MGEAADPAVRWLRRLSWVALVVAVGGLVWAAYGYWALLQDRAAFPEMHQSLPHGGTAVGDGTEGRDE